MKFKYKKEFIISLSISIITILLLIWLIKSLTTTIPINNLTLRSGPSITYTPIAKLSRGTKIQVIAKTKNWNKVLVDSKQIGWIPSWLLYNNKINTVTPLSETTIILDPGHGGVDSGALSYDQKKQEQTYTLQLAQKTAKILKSYGANVVMTRNSNKTVSLQNRPKIAQDHHANIFISFHFDSSPHANSETGYTTYYYHPGNSYRLALILNQAFTNLPLKNNGVLKGNYLVIRDNKVTSVLLEMGYMDNTKNLQLITNQQYQNKIAHDISIALVQYVNSSYKV